MDCEIPHWLDRGTKYYLRVWKQTWGKPRRENLKRTNGIRDRPRMVCQRRRWAPKGVDCEIPHCLERGTNHFLQGCENLQKEQYLLTVGLGLSCYNVSQSICSMIILSLLIPKLKLRAKIDTHKSLLFELLVSG